MKCDCCNGTGEIEVEAYRPQSFSRDVGYIDVQTAICECCDGTGEIEEDE